MKPDIIACIGGKMKWDDDKNCYEKRLLLDGIVKFINEFRDLDASEISLDMLYVFIDIFFKENCE